MSFACTLSKGLDVKCYFSMLKPIRTYTKWWVVHVPEEPVVWVRGYPDVRARGGGKNNLLRGNLHSREQHINKQLMRV